MLNSTTNKRFGKYRRSTVNKETIENLVGLKDSDDEEAKLEENGDDR
jgi:hypothetical protein